MSKGDKQRPIKDKASFEHNWHKVFGDMHQEKINAKKKQDHAARKRNIRNN